ncbi:hypothetical protein PF010_g30074 [Phytophthora fragariae]|uniref:Uncharacterized protein n=1 Tax=Phytophthora fragariae TaxID=53985 RepID=A0A6A3E5Y0_9STRA|nr:hypothetical protein PF009_g20909 [Phytophthora fragariae]KAE9060797.1 hypothetical protein PF010_g30074 [Phytophthora fragariae]KAE9061854.1 hypothetical protein PF006_g31297 [Phytophthora fragariae]KAE9264815.1 hypothetical protein PF001_g31138 [Phytophthora fragariae]KAE9269368.1 hypothetical protein PF008_g30879 [Phytophthora fragariae]
MPERGLNDVPTKGVAGRRHNGVHRGAELLLDVTSTELLDVAAELPPRTPKRDVLLDPDTEDAAGRGHDVKAVEEKQQHDVDTSMVELVLAPG